MGSDVVWLILILPAFFVLNEGAKLVTDNAAGIARRTGRSKFVIGVLLVSTLGALPEVLVALLALLRGHPDLAIGSALGSHVLNASFMIGLPAVFVPIMVRRDIFSRDIVFLGVITLVVAALLADGDLTFFEGVVLMLLFIPYATNLLTTGRTQTPELREQLAEESEIELELMGTLFQRRVAIRAGFPWMLLGLVLLFIGAEVVTRGAESLLVLFGADEFLVGITVLSIGTSLPDIAAAVQAVRRGHPDLALAIGIGASIFTMLLTLGIMGIAFPQTFDGSDLHVTIAVMSFQILILLIFAATGRVIGRVEGMLIFLCYPTYVAIEVLLERNWL